MLSSVFVTGGLSTFRAPARVAPAAEPVAVPVASRVPGLPEDPEQLVRINAAVQVGAGVLLATGRLPRLAALALAGSLIPTTLAGHAWWKEEEPERRAQQRTQFLKNVSLLGGLLIASADTHGKPSAAYRARRTVSSGRKQLRHVRNDAAHAVQSATDAVQALPATVQHTVARHH